MVPQPVPEALNTARLEQPGLFCTLYSAVEGPRTVTTIWRNIPCSSTFFHVHPQLTPSTIISIWEGCEEKLILIKKPKTQHRTEVCWMSDTLVMKCPGEKERTVSGRRVLQPFMVHQRKERCLGSVIVKQAYSIVSRSLLCPLLHLKSDTKFRTLDNSMLVDFINKTRQGMPLAIYLQDQTIQGVISV